MNYDLNFIEGLRSRLLRNDSEQAITLPGEYADNKEVTCFSLDLSGSMGSGDYPPTRYLAGVAAAEKFIQARLAAHANDVFGAVVFDTASEIVCAGVPIAKAMDKIVRTLERMGIRGGTDINKGLIGAHECLRSIASPGRRRVILLTDGQGGNPLRQADFMKIEGILIDVIGIGGSRSDVNEVCLKKVASVVDEKIRYRFIGDRDDLMSHFKNIANDLSFRR